MPVGRAKTFFDQYTSDLKSADLERLFTRDTAGGLPLLHAPRRYRRGSTPRPGTGAGRSNCGSCSMRSRCGCRRRGACSTACRSPPSLLGLILLFRGFAPVSLLFFPFTPATCRCRGGRTARCGWSLGVRRAESADPDGGRRPAVAQRRPRDRARHPARHAAGRHATMPATRSCAASRGRRTPSAATSTTSCRCPTAGSCSRSATSPARAARPRC